MTTMKQFTIWGLEVLRKEAQAIHDLEHYIAEHFAQACEILLNCKGHIIVIGLGKSGHIGNKIAATLASTGSPAFFVHASEATHGDFGMITADDVVLAISNSGKTSEILTLLPHITQLAVKLISITSDPTSPLAQEAAVNLNTGVQHEAGPFALAPTSSTTATLALGDALAIALMRARNFTHEDFARSHPGGIIGRRLLLRVSELMHTGKMIPKVHADALIKDALIEMTEKRLGMTTIVDDDDRLLGIFTDGDLRRVIEQGHNLTDSHIVDLMVRECKTIQQNILAFEALTEMETHKITVMPVVDAKQTVLGVLHMHDILQAGVI
ncbi:MAG: KpsF/GutQ family sugar-phosphate isomerase [Gammaproteobacteria bacterium]|nr:KpsF/GutQ family sugar-phosphate isomerase [Gammaproteobacteria bacterium]